MENSVHLLNQCTHRFIVAVFVMIICTTPRLSAQTTTPTGGTVPTADPADVSSVDAIIAAIYDVVSGPAGEERGWNRFRSLFDSEARLIPTSPNQARESFTMVLSSCGESTVFS